MGIPQETHHTIHTSGGFRTETAAQVQLGLHGGTNLLPTQDFTHELSRAGTRSSLRETFWYVHANRNARLC